MILQEFTDYLKVSGYRHIVGDQYTGMAFIRDKQRILILDECFILEEECEGSDDTLPRWHEVSRVSGLYRLDFLGFALILHAIGAVSIKDNFRKTNDSPAPAYPMNPLFKTLERFAV